MLYYVRLNKQPSSVLHYNDVSVYIIILVISKQNSITIIFRNYYDCCQNVVTNNYLLTLCCLKSNRCNYYITSTLTLMLLFCISVSYWPMLIFMDL